MTTAIAKRQSAVRTALIDAALVGAACLIPTISHLTALPLYRLNPMALVLVGGMVAVRDRRNALLLAVLLPTVSMLAVGMPSPAKALCMAAELLTVASLATLAERAWGRQSAALPFALARFGAAAAMMTGALMGGKAVYYGLKALLLPSAALVGTPVLTQAAAVAAAAVLYALFRTKK